MIPASIRRSLPAARRTLPQLKTPLTAPSAPQRTAQGLSRAVHGGGPSTSTSASEALRARVMREATTSSARLGAHATVTASEAGHGGAPSSSTPLGLLLLGGGALAVGLIHSLTANAGRGPMLGSVSVEVLDDEDPRVAGDVLRASAKLAEGARWVDARATTTLTKDYERSVPAGGALRLTAGFTADASVELRGVVPSKDGEGSRVPPVPTTAASARALVPGTELEVRGHGCWVLSAGAGVEQHASAPGVEARAGVSVGGKRTTTGDHVLSLRRGSGSEVEVTVQHVETRADKLGAKACASVEVDGDAVARHVLGTSHESGASLLHSVELGAGDVEVEVVPGDGVVDVVRRAGANAIAAQVNERTRAEAHAAFVSSHRVLEETRYVIDLDTEAGKAAYEDLVRLYDGSAAHAAAKEGSGVVKVTTSSVEDRAGFDAGASVGGEKLLLSTALREKKDIVTKSEGRFLARTSSAASAAAGDAIYGDQAMRWETVHVKKGTLADGADDVATYFHFTLDKKDKLTGPDEVVAFSRFADVVGAADAELRDVEMAPVGIVRALFTNDDDTRVKVDLYFTDKGLRTIANAPTDQVRAIYGNVAGRLDPRAIGVPLDDVDAREMAGRHERALGFFAGALLHGTGYQSKLDVEDEYRARTGRDLAVDAPVFAGADALVEALAPLSQTGEQGFLEALGAISAGPSALGTIGTLAQLAGKDDTLLHEVSLRGKTVNLRAVDEGRLE